MSRFTIEYLIDCFDGEVIEEKANKIALEQSVELPYSVLNDRIIEHFIGKVEQIEETGNDKYLVEISYPSSIISGDLTQFLNVLLGNISLFKEVEIINVDWGPVLDWFPGPRFGIQGVRVNLGITGRPLSCTALKPVGFTPDELADLAFQFATGGIDIIKDDHGLANQDAAPFQYRVKACVDAIKNARDYTEKNSWYFPNITTNPSKLIDNYKFAEDAGADGVLVCPHLVGLEQMAEMAESDVNLPIMAHPAFSGSYLNGFSHSFLYGSLWRAFGADFVIYPNHGGRFSFSLNDCIGINQALQDPMVPFATSFPTPGGGLERSELDYWIDKYGIDIVFLMGASLYKDNRGIKAASIDVLNTLQGIA